MSYVEAYRLAVDEAEVDRLAADVASFAEAGQNALASARIERARAALRSRLR